MGARLVGGLFKRLGGRAALGTAAKRLGGLALTEAKSAAAKAATEQAGNLAAQAVNAGADKLGGALGVTAGGGFLANLQGGMALAPGLLGNSGSLHIREYVQLQRHANGNVYALPDFHGRLVECSSLPGYGCPRRERIPSGARRRLRCALVSL